MVGSFFSEVLLYSYSVLLDGFPSPIFSKILGGPPPPSTFANFVSSLFTGPPSKMQKWSFSPSETFKLLLFGCQYGHTIVRRNAH